MYARYFMGTPQFAAEALKSMLENNVNVVGVYTQPHNRLDEGIKLKISGARISGHLSFASVYPTNFEV